ncbi:MAG: hypothetical protein IJV62_00165 [Eggerthellaceae bacterium]|nr:hypothetical protein [Eggerthellaceae bacterium]
MPDVLIKNVSAEDKERLRVQAAKNGRSMQEELRIIISNAVNHAPQLSLYNELKDFFELAGDDFLAPPRTQPRDVIDFD